LHPTIALLIDNIEKAIIGKTDAVTMVIGALLCGGHVLIEDVPGVGKTQLVLALAQSVGGKFNRIQLTPDIMPSDIVGFSMPNMVTKEFEFKPGAAMCNFLLADEINRASPKVQSSLLEVMEERQVTVDTCSYVLPRPFMTLATQNPIETFGTYHLPEAQMDRFLIRISLGYLDQDTEIQLLDRKITEQTNVNLSAVLTESEIIQMQEEVQNIKSHDSIKEYIIKLVNSTRNNENLKLGVSPRGSIGLHNMAKAVAFIVGREFITPDDVLRCAVPVLAHRIILSQRGKGAFKTTQSAVENLLKSIIIP